MVAILTVVAAVTLITLQRALVGEGAPAEIAGLIFILVLDVACWFGLIVVKPNTEKVLQLFGDDRGTIKDQGFRGAKPLKRRRTVAGRISNGER